MSDWDRFDPPAPPAVEGFRPPANATVAADGRLLERYLEGDHRGVWSDLRLRGALAGEARSEALDVARETMGRVARNADLLADRLTRLGWRAHGGVFRMSWDAAGARAAQAIAGATAAPLPLSLAAFWQQVGGVDFVGGTAVEPHPLGLGDDLIRRSDALCVYPANALAGQIDDWRARADWYARHAGASAFPIDLAPDIHQKVSIRGGAAYCIFVPSWDTDPIVANAPIEEPFTDHLRRAFAWGGFPGLERFGDEPAVRDLVARLTEGMEAF